MRDRSRSLAGYALAGALLSGVLAAPAAADTLAGSRFGRGVEGWRVSGDPLSVIPTFVSEGGSPGGYIETVDSGGGVTMRWVAPAKFLGDKSAAYGGSLRFHLRQSTTSSQFDLPDVVLTGGGLTLTYDTAVNPAAAPTWTRYRVPLREAGWLNGSVPATRRELRRVLGSLDELLIRAEFSSSADIDGLDSVFITDSSGG